MRQKITVPLPPSVNSMYMYAKYSKQKIYKPEARDYLEVNTLILTNWVKKHFVKPVTGFTHFDMEFILGNKNSDSHNYKKLIFDLLQHAGIVENDKWILDRTQKVDYDKADPRVIISWVSPT